MFLSKKKSQPKKNFQKIKDVHGKLNTSTQYSIKVNLINKWRGENSKKLNEVFLNYMLKIYEINIDNDDKTLISQIIRLKLKSRNIQQKNIFFNYTWKFKQLMTFEDFYEIVKSNICNISSWINDKIHFLTFMTNQNTLIFADYDYSSPINQLKYDIIITVISSPEYDPVLLNILTVYQLSNVDNITYTDKDQIRRFSLENLKSFLKTKAVIEAYAKALQLFNNYNVSHEKLYDIISKETTTLSLFYIEMPKSIWGLMIFTGAIFINEEIKINLDKKTNMLQSICALVTTLIHEFIHYLNRTLRKEENPFIKTKK